MPVLTVAHDVVCPWCWVARQQASRLRAEFPEITLDWRGFELLPEGMEYTPGPPEPPGKPAVPSRFELLLLCEGLTIPERTKPFKPSRRALEGAEAARMSGKMEPYLDALYHAYWEEDGDLGDPGLLREVARTAGLDAELFEEDLNSRRYRDRIVEFDEPAHAAGIWNVPTWKFPDGWVAEQPYSVLQAAARRMLEKVAAV